MSTKVTSASHVEAILRDYDYFIFDCDGVIWTGNHLLPHVDETISLLKQAGKKVYFVTNNSSKSRNDYLTKFASMGIHGIDKSEVFGSSYATAVYVDSILGLPKDKKVWVLGEKGIETELQERGYTTVGGTDPSLMQVPFDDSHPALTELDDAVGAVVAGLSFNLSYLKLSATLQYLLRGLPFLATNIDSTFPAHGKLLMGAGSIIESVAYAAGRQPDAICGKPNQAMLDAIKAENPPLKAAPKRGLMVGDRLNTDMKFGRDGGLDTLLVLTGIETEDTVHGLAPAEQPTYYASKLGDLFELTH
ncbi:4-nitrophenylphosphatase [Diutina catenulata]